MKIYSIKPMWIGDDNVFKNMRPMEPEKWGSETLEKQRRVEPLDMVWAIDSTDKPIGDFIMFPGAGLATTKSQISHFKRFAPLCLVNDLRLDGVDSPYALLQITNHKLGDKELPHIFMMFKQYKVMLVTQIFKDEWNRLGLTGADFQEVTEIPDTNFIAVTDSFAI